MEEKNQNILDDINEIKRTNPWLVNFGFSDEEIKKIITIVAEVILGKIKLADFQSQLSLAVKREWPILKQVAFLAATKRFLPLEKRIGDVKGFIKGLGMTADELKVTPLKADSKDKPTFSFSTEDEEEAKQFTPVAQSEGGQPDYERFSEAIITAFGYSEPDENLRKRLKNIVVAQLKNVRDGLEAAEVLMKNKKVGGMEFSDSDARRLIKLIDSERENILPSQKSASQPKANNIVFPTKKPMSVAHPADSFKKTITLEEKKKNDNEKNKIPNSKFQILNLPPPEKIAPPVTPPSAKPILERRAGPVIAEEEGLPVVRMPGEISKPLPNPLLRKERGIEEKKISNIQYPIADNLKEKKERLNDKIKLEEEIFNIRPVPFVNRVAAPPKITQAKSQRPNLDGVKFTQKLVGPVEELAGMTLIDFRRLGRSPKEQAVEIKERIELLEKDSYGKRLQGIAAWQRSEVNKFYRLLGQLSMQEGKAIERIIQERIAAGKPTLSLEEFEAVMELNKELRY